MGSFLAFRDMPSIRNLGFRFPVVTPQIAAQDRTLSEMELIASQHVPDTVRPMTDPVFDLLQIPVHLGLGATVEREPVFTGDLDWYMAYGARHAVDGAEGRLVSIHRFSTPWASWEMHPIGAELVICLTGRIVVHQEMDGSVRSVCLTPYQAVINPPGVWHTADVTEEATALFITAGTGTQTRPR